MFQGPEYGNGRGGYRRTRVRKETQNCGEERNIRYIIRFLILYARVNSFTELVKQQKLAFLTEGCVFKVVKGAGQKDKSKKEGPQFMWVKVTDNLQELGWAPIAEPAERPANMTTMRTY